MAESHYKWYERLSRNCAIGIAQFQNSLLDCYITAKSTYQSAIIFVNEFVQLATAQVASATFDSPERILTFCPNLVSTLSQPMTFATIFLFSEHFYQPM
jgi:hypothetical protein